MSEFTSGHILAERYKVVSLLGAGGMGAVYLVEDLKSQQKYALKTILATSVLDRNLKRFEMEINATKILEHPNLVQIYDFGFINETQPYFVMDYWEGQDLAALIKSKGSLSIDEAIDVFFTICNALTYAHSKGVVHRDLKPSNVMITGGVIKVLDFGIAKVFRDETEFNTVTQTGEVFGSPYYMSPEQCLGKTVDLRSDVYSLGCMFFEALTGAPPFVGDTAVSTMLKHQSQEPLTLKEATLGGNFPADLELVVAQMLSKNPAYRYPDLLQVAEDLRLVKLGEPVKQLRVEEKFKPPSTKVIAALLGAALVCVVITSWLLTPSFRQSYQKVFGSHDPSPRMPTFETMREKLPVRTSYFSTLNPKNPKVRDFRFPVHSFGDFGHGDDVRSYIPARGLHRDVVLPLSLHIKQDCEAIGGFRNDEVSNLTLRGYMVQDKTTEILKGWHEITSLIMDDTDIGNSSVANFTGMKKLTTLGVNDTNITGDALLSLPLEQFHQLNVNHMKNANVLFPRLADGNTIVCLSLIGANINDDDLKLVGKFLKLQNLSLLENEITDKGIEHLAAMPLLNTLWIEGKSVTPEILGPLKKMKLSKIVIENCPWSFAEELDFRHKMKRGNKSLKLDIKFDNDRIRPKAEIPQ